MKEAREVHARVSQDLELEFETNVFKNDQNEEAMDILLTFFQITEGTIDFLGTD